MNVVAATSTQRLDGSTYFMLMGLVLFRMTLNSQNDHLLTGDTILQ